VGGGGGGRGGVGTPAQRNVSLTLCTVTITGIITRQMGNTIPGITTNVNNNTSVN